MGFKQRLSPNGLLLVIITLWLSACDLAPSSSTSDPSQSSSEPESDASSNTALIEDGFYGQSTSLDSNPSSQPEIMADVKSQGLNDEDDSINHLEQQDGEIVANIGFSEPQEDQPSTELIKQFVCEKEPTGDQQLIEVSIETACTRISNRLASVSMESCETANLKASQCKSVKQFPILFTEFLPVENKQPLGRILVVGGTHGDELTSVSIVFRWIAKLNKFHSGLFHWRLAPMLNPDGVLKREASRTNQNGVDLNRNMPSSDWEENAIKYWAEKAGKNKRRYPGPEAASEPETRWLIDQISSFKPDAIISVHAPYGVVDYDALILNTAPKNLGKLALNLLGTYPGSLGNYAGINLDIPVITLELPHAWVMPSEQESTKIWEDIVSWLRENVNNSELADH